MTMATPTRSRPRYDRVKPGRRATSSPWSPIGWMLIGGLVAVTLGAACLLLLFSLGILAAM